MYGGLNRIRRPKANVLLQDRLPSEEAQLTHWLVSLGLDCGDEATLLRGYCERLVAASIPVMRVSIGSAALDPTLEASGVSWSRRTGIQREDFTHAESDAQTDMWLRSPFYQLLEHGLKELRRRIGEDYREGEFELMDRLVRQDGMSDYLAILVDYGPGTTLGLIPGFVMSYQTDRAGGFDELELDVMRRLTRVFALAFKAITSVRTGRLLLKTYLGEDPARRVLEGAVVRGRAEPVEAVLWYSDLQGFTRIVDTAPRDQILSFLNEYAECLVSTIRAQNGEVLKFIGDGILAMFPLAEAGACARALHAVDCSLRQIDSINGKRKVAGLPWTDIHIALHVGEVLYGNIGSSDRLDFTVFGPAVNEVARIEAMCRSLEQRVLTSSVFALSAEKIRGELVSVGRYALRGVSRPEELFTIDQAVP